MSQTKLGRPKAIADVPAPNMGLDDGTHGHDSSQRHMALLSNRFSSVVDSVPNMRTPAAQLSSFLEGPNAETNNAPETKID